MTTRSVDIAIIGGGVIGLTLARSLALAQASLAVIDAGSELPPATAAAAGMLAPSFETGSGSAGDALYRFGAESLAMWPDFAAALEEETGLSIDYRPDGVLGVALDGAEAAAISARVHELETRGAPARLLSGDEARILEPALSGAVVAALYAQNDAQVDARKLLAALRRSVERKAGPIIGARLERAVHCGSGFALTLTGGERVEAQRIVLASGAAATAGLIDGLPAPPVFPVKGEAVAVEAPRQGPARVIRAPGAYLCPKADGRLVIGATEVRGCADISVDPEAVEGLKIAAARAVPAVVDSAEIECWAGLRPGTPDGAPILGEDSRGPEGVFVALGHYRNGVLLAPASAEALVPRLLGDDPLTETQVFRPERFA